MPPNLQFTTVTGEEAGLRRRKGLVVQVGDREMEREFWLADIHDP